MNKRKLIKSPSENPFTPILHGRTLCRYQLTFSKLTASTIQKGASPQKENEIKNKQFNREEEIKKVAKKLMNFHFEEIKKNDNENQLVTNLVTFKSNNNFDIKKEESYVEEENIVPDEKNFISTCPTFKCTISNNINPTSRVIPAFNFHNKKDGFFNEKNLPRKGFIFVNEVKEQKESDYLMTERNGNKKHKKGKI